LNVGIKQVSEREIWVGEHLLSLGDDNILYETLVGEQDERTVHKIIEATDKILPLVEEKLKILVDLNKAKYVLIARRLKLSPRQSNIPMFVQR